MKIIIELDGTGEQQPEIKKIASSATEQTNSSLPTFVSASPVDAGQALLKDGSPGQSPVSSVIQNNQATVSGAIEAGHAPLPDGSPAHLPGSSAVKNSQVNNSSATAGAIDAGAAKAQHETKASQVEKGSGNNAVFDRSLAFNAGSFENSSTINN